MNKTKKTILPTLAAPVIRSAPNLAKTAAGESVTASLELLSQTSPFAADGAE